MSVYIVEDLASMSHWGGHSEAYMPLLNHVLENGEEITVRGRPTKEVLNNVVVIDDPTRRVIDVPGRLWSPWVALSEAMWILAGRGDTATLLPYNKRIKQFSDNGEDLWGAYGPRISSTIDRIIDLLNLDNDTRRAVIPIYKDRDAGYNSKDIPCNTSIMFKIRDHKLHMVITNRSNDIHWGLFAVNLFTFSVLQECVAACLSGVTRLGSQTHFSQSLHVYLDKFGADITDRMGIYKADYNSSNKQEIDFIGYHNTWRDIQDFAVWALGANYRNPKTPEFFDFVRKFLSLYKNKDDNTFYETMEFIDDLAENYPRYSDYCKVGKEFLIGQS